jgi:hypothetical protein
MRPYLLSYRSSYITVRRWLDVLSSLLYYFFSNMSMIVFSHTLYVIRSTLMKLRLVRSRTVYISS